MAETFDHQPLDVVCTGAARRPRILSATHQGSANVVPIAAPPTDRICRGHEVATVVKDQPPKERSSLEPRPAPGAPIGCEAGLSRAPEFMVDDPLVVTGIANAFMDDLAQVDAVLQQLIKRP